MDLDGREFFAPPRNELCSVDLDVVQHDGARPEPLPAQWRNVEPVRAARRAGDLDTDEVEHQHRVDPVVDGRPQQFGLGAGLLQRAERVDPSRARSAATPLSPDAASASASNPPSPNRYSAARTVATRRSTIVATSGAMRPCAASRTYSSRVRSPTARSRAINRIASSTCCSEISSTGSGFTVCVAEVVGEPANVRHVVIGFLEAVDWQKLDEAVLDRDDLDGRPGELTRGMLAQLREWAAGA
ncbi:hypothetical protein ACWGH2_02450 [Streptomyces sp. NPDC054871]